MPNEKVEGPKYKPFSEEEKKQILARHIELVDNMNKYLPNGQKLSYNKDLAKSLDDPKTYGQYRIAQEIRDIKAKQKAIQNDLESRFGKSRHDPNPMSRTMFFTLDPSGTDAAKAYNEKIYQDYLQDPNKVVYLRYKKVMEFDPRPIQSLKDDPLKLAEYYRDNYPLCDEAFAFASVVNRSEYTPAMKDALKSISKPIEALGYPQLDIEGAAGLDYFAFPKLNKEQAAIIANNDYELMGSASPEMIATINGQVMKNTTESPTEYFDKFDKANQKLEAGYFVKHRAEQATLDANKQTVIKEADYDKVFENKTGAYRIAERSADDIFEIRCMNKSFQKDYIKNFQTELNQKMGRNKPFNMEEIVKEHRGGIWERKIRHSTSPEYKAFRDAFKNYNDPNSKDYCRDNKLREATDAYLNHKGVKDEADLDRLSGTSLGRSKLALSVRSTLNNKEALADKVEENWLKGYNNVVVSRQPFLKAKDVEEKQPEANEVKEEKNKEVEVQKDNEMDKALE